MPSTRVRTNIFILTRGSQTHVFTKKYCVQSVLSDRVPDVVGFNPIALRKAKIVCNFGLSECTRVKDIFII